MAAAAPMQQQPGSPVLDPGNDFLNRGAESAFAGFHRDTFMVPCPLKIGAEMQTCFPFLFVHPHVRMGRARMLQGGLDCLRRNQAFVPPALQFASHHPVPRIDGIVLLTRAMAS
ncbi:MAG: hypothetical protein OXF88_00815 [Rhodobacteraceae bacterium]|nr:hypothetical protein [Paracoccaceae bacterium]MCY4138867.1 hypothetical protein [Paracoccaceae bacterium]